MTKRFTLIFLMAFVIALPITAIWLNSLWQKPINATENQSKIGIVTTLKQHTQATTSTATSLDSQDSMQSNITKAGDQWQHHLTGSSIADTEPPASFEISDGILIRSESLRAIFDYFLALDGEVSIDTIRDILHRYAQSQLTAAESQQVIAAFDQYFEYLDTINEAQHSMDPSLSLQEKHEWIKAQRQAILGDELAKQYFEYDEIYDDYSLAKLSIMNNQSFSMEEKLRAIDDLNHQLPQELVSRESRDNEVKLALMNDREQRQQLSPGELYQSRLNQHGYEATQRLTDLDNHRQLWQERYEKYTQEAQTIRESNLADDDKQFAIDQLRQEHFSEPEQIRVATLDEMTHY